MTGVGWFMTIVLGGLAGWIAENIMKANMGLITNIIVGILGAVLLNAILGFLGFIPPGGWLWQSIIAIIGACILIWLYRTVRGRG
jgi:uncharacterized membrane protein YeaQ/YmgE (transglycosylase-associated protein family)